MLFNSINFIFVFLPIVIIVYFLLNKLKFVKIAIAWLVVASLFFYSYWKLDYLLIILFSMIFNYSIGFTLSNEDKLRINKKLLMIIGISGNIALLCYYKYFDFFIQNVNFIFHQNFNYLNIVLPLGISFFTFQQIAYIVDSYKGNTKEYDFLTYTLFVSFFPQLIAGPIVHHAEMMPQFNKLRNKFINWHNIMQGLLLFSIGLFKKVIIADTLAAWATLGFDANSQLSLIEAWVTMLCYTFQIYYDFSGYTDMALGIGLMFNIKLPQNFNNPYKSIDIQDFWRRWHMTLSRFLKDYIYIPLGGNRKGNIRTYVNLFIVFLICGIWHGASWMFVLWGVVHGIAIIINRLWQKSIFNIPIWLSWIINFVFINFTWVLFRANNLSIVKNIYESAIGLNGFSMPRIFGAYIHYKPIISTIYDKWETASLFALPVLIAFIFIKYCHSNIKIIKPGIIYSFFIAILIYCSVCVIAKPTYISPFIYFNF